MTPRPELIASEFHYDFNGDGIDDLQTSQNVVVALGDTGGGPGGTPSVPDYFGLLDRDGDGGGISESDLDANVDHHINSSDSVLYGDFTWTEILKILDNPEHNPLPGDPRLKDSNVEFHHKTEFDDFRTLIKANPWTGGKDVDAVYTGDTVYGDTDGTGGTGGTGETLRVPDAFGLLDRDQPPEDGRITVEDLVTSAGGEDTNGPQGKIDGNVDAYDQTLYHTGDLDHLDKLLDQTQGHADAVIFEQDGREVSVADAKALKVLLDKYVVEAVAEPHIAESDPQNPPLADPSHLTQAEGDFFLV